MWKKSWNTVKFKGIFICSGPSITFKANLIFWKLKNLMWTFTYSGPSIPFKADLLFTKLFPSGCLTAVNHKSAPFKCAKMLHTTQSIHSIDSEAKYSWHFYEQCDQKRMQQISK